jgi:predicted dehydrogenase
MFALKELDAVIVASTPNVHFTQDKTALESGRHVLLEKPMTFTAAEARKLVELVANKKLQFVMSCPWHFTAHGIEAQRLIHFGATPRWPSAITKSAFSAARRFCSSNCGAAR